MRKILSILALLALLAPVVHGQGLRARQPGSIHGGDLIDGTVDFAKLTGDGTIEATGALTIIPASGTALVLGDENTTTVTITTDGGSVEIDGALDGAVPAGITADTDGGSWTFTKDAAGTVTLTSADDDADAALTIAAGGTGALTIGDSGSTSAITSSDWAISATGVATGLGNITSDGTVDANAYTSDASAGLDTQAAGALLIGAATATSVEIADAGVTTDIQGPVTILGTTGAGLDTAGATAMYIAEATATSLNLGASDITTTVLGALVGNTTLDVDSITVDAGAGIDNQAAGALMIGAATATSVEIADSGVTTDIQGPVTILGSTGAGIDTAGANALYIAEATATSLQLGASDITTNVLGPLTVLGSTGAGLDAAGATALFIGEATATSVSIGASDITTTVLGPLTVLGSTGAGLDAASATALFLGEATATSVSIGASDIITTVLGPLRVNEGASRGIDTTGAGLLEVGAATATSVVIADTSVLTDIQGTLSVDEVATFDATVVFGGGQTRKCWIPAANGASATEYGAGFMFDSTNPPAATVDGTASQSEIIVAAFNAAGSGNDDEGYLWWRVPDGYVTDSLRLNIVWYHPAAESDGDDVVFDMTVNAIAAGEDFDVAGTAFTESADEQTDGVADLLITTQLNPEVETIAVDDLVMIHFWVDASECHLTANLHVVGFEFEWESTE